MKTQKYKSEKQVNTSNINKYENIQKRETENTY